MINILAITGSKSEANQFLLIKDQLLKNGIKMFLATSRPMVYDFIKESGWNNVELFELKKINNKSVIDSKLLKKYSTPTVAEIISSEQVIKNWSLRYKINLLYHFLLKFETLIKEKNIDLIIKYPTCSLIGRTAFSSATANGKKTLIINTGPIVSETFTLNDIDEGWLWSEFFEFYNQENYEIDNEIKNNVQEIVCQIKADKNNSLKVKKLNLKSPIYHLLLYLKQKLQNINDPIQKSELKKEMSFLFGKINPAIKYSTFNKNKKYIFFPLHIPWDAQIATRNPMFSSQEAIGEMLSRSIPPGYTLYIKEHPYYSGGVNRKMLKYLKKFANIEILHPSISSLQVIENAEVVVTINSTAGWESIVMQTPLVVLGNPYYAYFKGAYKVENINELPKIINAALSEGNNVYEKDLNNWNHFINSSVKSSHKGSMSFYKNYMGLGTNLDEKRIALLSQEIKNKILKTLKKEL